jgi:hypothetical protein
MADYRLDACVHYGPTAGFHQATHEDSVARCWTLGLLKGKECKGEVKLSISGSITLTVGGHVMPLVHVLVLNRRGLRADKRALLRAWMAIRCNPRQAWDQSRGAGKMLRPLRTRGMTGRAAAATSKDKYVRYGPPGNIYPATSALNRNALPWVCLFLPQEKP